MTTIMPEVEAGGFSSLGLDARLVDAVRALGYEEPTAIQREAIPPFLEGRDLLGQAATGTGKTAAFALPLLHRIAAGEKRGRIRALILTPTRELAMQVAEAIGSYGASLGIRVAAIYGGQPIYQQTRVLRAGVDVVVATPGRAIDHIGRKSLELDGVETLILDEADEMLDMGFAEELEQILTSVPKERQTALFSATMAPPILTIAKRHLNDPVQVRIARETTSPGEEPRVRENVYLVNRKHKIASLVRVLDVERPASAIVFCRTRTEVDELTERLAERGYRSEALHGGLAQDQRDRVMRRFRDGVVTLLVATDIAARGIDVEHISHVVNFDVPPSVDVYTHRIGRTGRAGRDGVALTFAEPRERAMLRNIENVTKRKLVLLPVPSVADLRARRVATLRETLVTMLGTDKVARYRDAVASLAQDHDSAEIAAAALAVADRAIDGDREEEEIPGVEERPFVAKSGPRPKRIVRAADAGLLAKIFIGLGRQAGVRPGDLVGAIANEAGLDSKQIGSIDIGDRFSLVEVPDALADRVVTALRDTSIRGRRTLVRRDRGARN